MKISKTKKKKGEKMKKYSFKISRNHPLYWDKFDEEFEEDGGNYRAIQCGKSACYLLISDRLYQAAIYGGYSAEHCSGVSEREAVNRRLFIDAAGNVRPGRNYHDQNCRLVATCDDMDGVHAELEKIYRCVNASQIVTVYGDWPKIEKKEKK